MAEERVSIPRRILAWMRGVIPIGKKRAEALREMHDKHGNIKPAVPKGQSSSPNPQGNITIGPK
jgi:hypothetical protein